MAFVESSITASEALKKALDKAKEDFKKRADNISLWQRQIVVLKQQIEELEKKINEAETSPAIGFETAEKALNDEASTGVLHWERVEALDIELAELDTSLSLTNARLSLARDRYLTLKENVPF